MRTQDEIVQDLANLLSDFQGREYSGEIGQDTLFFADLGFASIDAVMLGEKLEEMYQQKLPFNKFVAEAVRQEMHDLRVGDLADFLAGTLR